MADVFISYKKEERDRAVVISRALQLLQASTWLDAELSPGRSFTEEIRDELAHCQAQVVCWSPSAMVSEWVRGEAEFGRQRGVLIPIFIERCELLPPFNMIHAEDLSDRDGSPTHSGWQNVLRRLGVLLKRPGLGEFARIREAADPIELRSWSVRFSADPLASPILASSSVITAADPTLTGIESLPQTAPPTIEALRAASESANFRLRVFNDAAKRFKWKDAEEEARLRLEAEALGRALRAMEAERDAIPKPPRKKLGEHVSEYIKKRTLPEKFILSGMAASASFVWRCTYWIA